MILISSFGYSKSGPPKDATYVEDVRRFRNPHHDKKLRKLRGWDEPVRKEVLRSKGARDFVIEQAGKLANERRSPVYLAIGCLAGRHRSVALAEAICERLLTHHGVVSEVIHIDCD